MVVFIARATCKSREYGEIQVVICSDEETEKKWQEKNSEVVTYTMYTRPIADSIMKAAAKNTFPVRFECNEVVYELIRYSVNHFERHYNQYRSNYVASIDIIRPKTEIFVYSQRCRCGSCYYRDGWDKIENVCGIVSLAEDRRKQVEIDLQKCTRCNSYFIEGQSLSIYESRFGLLCITKRHITGNEPPDRNAGLVFQPDSVLSRNGYTTQLPENERRRILAQMIEKGIKKAEIKDKLSEFIYFRGDRFPEARRKWKADLDYVNAYGLSSQRKVKFI